MRLFVSHRTEYRFTEPQARLVQLLRVTPGSHGGQSVVSWRVEVDRDARMKRARDGYGNETTMLYVDGPIEGIAISVDGEVLTEDHAGMIGGTPEPLPPMAFLQTTALTAPDDALQELVAALNLPTDPLAGAGQGGCSGRGPPPDLGRALRRLSRALRRRAPLPSLRRRRARGAWLDGAVRPRLRLDRVRSARGALPDRGLCPRRGGSGSPGGGARLRRAHRRWRRGAGG
jgi:hypothetical protein